MKNKEDIKVNFVTHAKPTESQFAELIDSCVGKLDSTNELPVASVDNAGHSYLIGDTVYTCELVGGNYQWVPKQLGGGGGVDSSFEINDFTVPDSHGRVDFSSVPEAPTIFNYDIAETTILNSQNQFYNNSLSYILITNVQNSDYTFTFGNIQQAPAITIHSGKTAIISILTFFDNSFIAGVYENNNQ